MATDNIILHYNDLPASFKPIGDLAIDTETMGLDLASNRLCLLQIKDDTDIVHLVKFDADYSAPNLKKLLADNSVNKIFHYARFDMAAIYIYLGVMCENIFCTKIASKLCRTYTSYHGLKELCRELLGVELKKEQQTSYWGANELSEEQKAYAANDVLYLHNLKKHLIDRLVKEDRLALAHSCFKFLSTKVRLDKLHYTENNDIFSH